MNPSPNLAPFTSAHVRARIVKILLIVGAFVTCSSLLARMLSLAFPPLTEGQELADNPIGAVVVLLVALLGLLDFFLDWTTVVFFCIWLHRAYDNLRAFDSWRRLDYSPGWAVGSFFIPFVALVVPYRAVREVWQKSGPDDEAFLAEPSPPALFPLWWLFWLLAVFAGNISLRVGFMNVSQNTVTMIALISEALYLVATVCAYLVVHAIDKRQEATIGRLNLGKFSGPPPPPANLSMSGVVAPVPTP